MADGGGGGRQFRIGNGPPRPFRPLGHPAPPEAKFSKLIRPSSHDVRRQKTETPPGGAAVV